MRRESWGRGIEFKVSKGIATKPRSDLDPVILPRSLTPPQVGQSKKTLLFKPP